MRELPSSSRRESASAAGARSPRSRVTRIEASRELSVSGEPAGLAQLIKANASAFTFLGITGGVFVSRKFLIVPVGIGAMLVQDWLRDSMQVGRRGRGRRRRRA
jgi:hypothetical protein